MKVASAKTLYSSSLGALGLLDYLVLADILFRTFTVSLDSIKPGNLLVLECLDTLLTFAAFGSLGLETACQTAASVCGQHAPNDSMWNTGHLVGTHFNYSLARWRIVCFQSLKNLLACPSDHKDGLSMLICRHDSNRMPVQPRNENQCHRLSTQSSATTCKEIPLTSLVS